MRSQTTTDRPRKQLLGHYALILAVAGTVLFTNLGKARLWDRDEPRNAGCAEEMMARGDWVTPIFNDELRTAKPVLLYWLIMTAYSVFGVNEFAARFWSAALALGTVLATYHIGQRLFNSRVALWAALILSTSLMFDVAGRAATPDSVLIFLSTLSLLIFVLGTFKPRTDSETATAPQLRTENQWFPTNRATVVLLYAVMGLGLLAKGLVGLVIPTAIIGMFLLLMRMQNQADAAPAAGTDDLTNVGSRRQWLRIVGVILALALLDQFLGLKVALAAAGVIALVLVVSGRRDTLRFLRPFAPRHFFNTCWYMRPVTAIVVAMLVAAPWYIAVGIRTNGDFPRAFFLTEHFGRATTAMENHGGSLFYYPLAIMIGFFPWSILVVPMLMDLTRRIRRGDSWAAGYVFAACWIGVYVGVFSLATTKLPSYITPCYPALALLGGCFLHHWTRGMSLASASWPKVGIAGLAVVGVLIAIGVPVAATIFLPGKQWLGAIGLILVIGAAACYRCLKRNQPRHVMTALVATATAFTTALFGFATIAVDQHQQSHVMLGAIQQESSNPKIGTYGVLESSWVYYAKQPIWELSLGKRKDQRSPAAAQRKYDWQRKPRPDLRTFFADNDRDVFVITTREQYQQIQRHLPSDAVVLADTRYFMRKPNKRLIVIGRPRAAFHTAENSDAAAMRR